MKGGRHIAYPTQDGADRQPAAERPRQVRHQSGHASATARADWRLCEHFNCKVRLARVALARDRCVACVARAVGGLRAGKSDVADAAMRGDKAAVRALIAQKADVNAPQDDGATALHWAVYRGDTRARPAADPRRRERRRRPTARARRRSGSPASTATRRSSPRSSKAAPMPTRSCRSAARR